jgi:hypothetical protein
MVDTTNLPLALYLERANESRFPPPLPKPLLLETLAVKSGMMARSKGSRDPGKVRRRRK